jgi:hypothetical protein
MRPPRPLRRPPASSPPISVDLLREIRDEIVASPWPTPTPETYLTSPITHLIPFPPPAGEPIDEATVASIQRFLTDYVDCLDTGEYLAIYGAWTEDCVQRNIGARVEFVDALIRTAEQHISFPYPREWRPLLLRAWSISTGHIVVVVQYTPDDVQQTMLLVPRGDSWRIDDLWGIGLRAIGDSVSGPVYGTPVIDR